MVEFLDKVDYFILIRQNASGSSFGVAEALVLLDAIIDLTELIEVDVRVIGFEAYPADVAVLCVEVFAVEVLAECSESALVLYLVRLWNSDDCFQTIPTGRCEHHHDVRVGNKPLPFIHHQLLCWILVEVQDAQTRMLHQAAVIALGEGTVEHDCIQ